MRDHLVAATDGEGHVRCGTLHSTGFGLLGVVNRFSGEISEFGFPGFLNPLCSMHTRQCLIPMHILKLKMVDYLVLP